MLARLITDSYEESFWGSEDEDQVRLRADEDHKGYTKLLDFSLAAAGVESKFDQK